MSPRAKHGSVVCPGDVSKDLCVVVACKGVREHHHLEQRASQCPDVHCFVVPPAHMDLWGKKQGRTTLSVCLLARRAALDQLGKTQIPDLADSCMQEYVGRLYVAMDDFAAVQKVDAGEELQEPEMDLGLAEWLCLLPLRLHSLRHVSAIAVVHDEREQAVPLDKGFAKPHHVGMAALNGGFRQFWSEIRRVNKYSKQKSWKEELTSVLNAM